MPQYTYSALKSRVNAGIKGKIGILTDTRQTINDAVRQVISDFDLRSTRRKAQLTPNLFTGIYEYAAPSDLKSYGIITIEPQTNRQRNQFSLVPYEQFGRRQDSNSIAVNDYDFIRKVMVNTNVDDKNITLSELDTTSSGGGAWSGFGDVTTVSADSDDYVHGSASLTWNINADAGTTAGIVNSTLNSSDLSDYFNGNGAVFVWAKITDKTNITNFILRIGSSASAYHSKTITAASDGTAFRNGWNLLRFDMSSLTDTGSPDNTAITYAAIYMTKTTGKVSETDYRFDYLTVKRGEINNLIYYTKYGWQTSSGTYLENSTVDSDLLNADTDEYNLIIDKATELAAMEVDEYDIADRTAKKYSVNLMAYKLRNPSEALVMITTYADFIRN